MFDLPEGVIYLDGNPLGPLPKGVATRVAQTITAEWGQMLIRAWNEAGWPICRAGGRRPGGAAGGRRARSVVMGDTLSIKVRQASAAALTWCPSAG